MTSDYYAILGVSPSAEQATIRSAYRTLIRQHHPDSNPDPAAHERARSITEAYSVLRDPAKRAEYDARKQKQSASDVWRSFEEPPRPPTPPPARAAAVAAAAVAIMSVGAVWAWPEWIQSPQRTHHQVVTTDQPAEAVPAPSRPIIELEPETERLARLGGIADALVPPVAPPPERVPPEDLAPDPLPAPADSVSLASVPIQQAPMPRPIKISRSPAAPSLMSKAPQEPARPVASIAAPPPVSKESIATLESMSSGFYAQSLQHADEATKQLLLSVRIRRTTQRGACQTDSCVADSYLRQIRDVREIMEKRASQQ